MPTGNLDKSGAKLWEKVYNDSISGGDSKQVAAQKAWSAVKSAGWRKINGKWIKKSNAIVEFSLFISKATLDQGVMRWAAVNSDTDKDLYAERMSFELYQDFLGRIKENQDVPEKFKSLVTSNYWKKGMPYLSISHYTDMDGQAVPGEPTEIFIDGDKSKSKLKAKGILFDTPLGRAVWKSLKEDKDKRPEDRIRISIGFLDLEHKHGESGFAFKREGIYSLCPLCLEGVGDKIYTKGYLVHLALTRSPVNQRTEMVVLEEKSEMAKRKTRKEDAESIIGEELANEIDEKSRALPVKSDVLIEMSDTEEPTEEETQELIDSAENPSAEESPESVEKSETVVEKFEDDAMAKVANETHDDVSHLPYGGATSMRDAEQYVAAKNEAMYLMDMWNVFCNVIYNIFERGDVANKRESLNVAVDEFKNVLTAKAMVAFSVAAPAVIEEKSLPVVEEHKLQPAIDALLQSVDNSVSLKSDEERAAVLNPALQELANNITGYLKEKSVIETEQPVSPMVDKDTLLKEIKDVIQPLIENSARLANEVELLKAKSQAGEVVVKPRIPQPRTISASLIQKASEQSESKPGSLKSIIRRSVGLSE